MQVCFGARGEKACNGVKGVKAEEGRWLYVFSATGRSERRDVCVRAAGRRRGTEGWHGGQA